MRGYGRKWLLATLRVVCGVRISELLQAEAAKSAPKPKAPPQKPAPGDDMPGDIVPSPA